VSLNAGTVSILSDGFATLSILTGSDFSYTEQVFLELRDDSLMFVPVEVYI